MVFNPKAFWRNPTIEMMVARKNFSWYKPEFYLGLYHQAGLIVEELEKRLPKNASICELGCGGGRILAALKNAGFTNLQGIEINPDAIMLGQQRFDMTGIGMTCSAIEDADIPKVDCIYTHGVLMHLPPESEFVFDVIAERTNKLIMTVENEHDVSKFQWPRKYKFAGWHEVDSYSTEHWPPNGKNNIARIFAKGKK